jgi:hypothetical protein
LRASVGADARRAPPSAWASTGSKTGFAFRRQLVIGEHIVDFACTKVRLVVEAGEARLARYLRATIA